MYQRINDDFHEKITKDMLKNKNVQGATLCVESKDGSIAYLGSTGNLDKSSKYFIASVTKLYITAVLLMLQRERKISFQDLMVNYFDENTINELHVYKGVDYTNTITIEHLLSNQTGLPDYFYYESVKGDPVGHLKQMDTAWTIRDVLQRVKTQKPKFRPGETGKVNYSDTNYQILGAIIEKVTNMWIGDAFDYYIFKPLHLYDTFAFVETSKEEIAPLLHKKDQFFAPKYMASITAEGGIVSTAKDCMTFLKAFFMGGLFPISEIDKLTTNWRLILFPGQFYFGVGLEKLWTPRLYFPLKPIKEVLGFWGQTGAFAFYSPEKELFFTGTINQLSGFGHGAAYKAVTKIIQNA